MRDNRPPRGGQPVAVAEEAGAVPGFGGEVALHDRLDHPGADQGVASYRSKRIVSTLVCVGWLSEDRMHRRRRQERATRGGEANASHDAARNGVFFSRLNHGSAAHVSHRCQRPSAPTQTVAGLRHA